MINTIYFYIPSKEIIDSIPLNTNNYWPWMNWVIDKIPCVRSDGAYINYSGPYSWTIQTYMHLRDYGYPVQITHKLPRSGIIVAHSHLWPKEFRGFRSQFLVEIKPDKSLALNNPDFVITQNPNDAIFTTSFSSRADWVLYWPQGSLIPREATRRTIIKNACFFGNEKNFLTPDGIIELESKLSLMGIKLLFPERINWNDYSSCDVVVAVRRSDYFLSSAPPNDAARNKPASKLINSWLSGVPAILSPDPLYMKIRNNDLDFLIAENVDDIIANILSLREDAHLYRSMVENGQQKALHFSPEKITQLWINLFENKIIPKAKSKLCGPYLQRLFRLRTY
jgi:hypothetical protein